VFRKRVPVKKGTAQNNASRKNRAEILSPGGGKAYGKGKRFERKIKLKKNKALLLRKRVTMLNRRGLKGCACFDGGRERLPGGRGGSRIPKLGEHASRFDQERKTGFHRGGGAVPFKGFRTREKAPFSAQGRG